MKYELYDPSLGVFLDESVELGGILLRLRQDERGFLLSIKEGSGTMYYSYASEVLAREAFRLGEGNILPN